jgi:ankyrin repeat protein
MWSGQQVTQQWPSQAAETGKNSGQRPWRGGRGKGPSTERRGDADADSWAPGPAAGAPAGYWPQGSAQQMGAQQGWGGADPNGVSGNATRAEHMQLATVVQQLQASLGHAVARIGALESRSAQLEADRAENEKRLRDRIHELQVRETDARREVQNLKMQVEDLVGQLNHSYYAQSDDGNDDGVTSSPSGEPSSPASPAQKSLEMEIDPGKLMVQSLERGDTVAMRTLASRPDSAALNVQDSLGRTVLHAAARNRLADLCLSVLARPDFEMVNARTNGWTALHMAADRSLESVCVAILDRSDFDSVNAKNDCNRTALHLAANRGLTSVCTRLLSCEAFTAVNDCGWYGWTCLHCAACNGHESVVSAVLRDKRFTAIDQKTTAGETALNLAERSGAKSVVALLLKHQHPESRTLPYRPPTP